MHEQTGELFLVREIDLESLTSSGLTLQVQVRIHTKSYRNHTHTMAVHNEQCAMHGGTVFPDCLPALLHPVNRRTSYTSTYCANFDLLSAMRCEHNDHQTNIGKNTEKQ